MPCCNVSTSLDYIKGSERILSSSNKKLGFMFVNHTGGDAVRKPLFEEFWRSGAPLIGEERSGGWAEWSLQHQKAVQEIKLLPVQGTSQAFHSSSGACSSAQ